MSLIFDRFPTRQRAVEFAEAMEREFGVSWEIFDDQENAFNHDPFPFVLTAPIVHVSRNVDEAKQQRIINRVDAFGGEFAGT